MVYRESFQQGLLAGNRKVIYPILHHVLSRFVQLQKRAYVARFLVNVEVPAEFMHDDGTLPWLLVLLLLCNECAIDDEWGW